MGKCAHKKPFYLGSGVAIRNAIRKYGKQNFIKEIVFESESLQVVADKERELSLLWNVSKDLTWYNMKPGGKGGSLCGRILSKETCQKISVSKKGSIPWNKGLQNDKTKHKKETIEKIRLANKGQKNPSGKEHPNAKKVVFSKNGQIFEVLGIREFCRNKDISYPTIMWRLRNNKNDSPTRDGWTVRYAQ